jgi:hypothetical protein
MVGNFYLHSEDLNCGFPQRRWTELCVTEWLNVPQNQGERGFRCRFLRIIPAILKPRAGIWHEILPANPPKSKGHMLLVLSIFFLAKLVPNPHHHKQVQEGFGRS